MCTKIDQIQDLSFFIISSSQWILSGFGNPKCFLNLRIDNLIKWVPLSNYILWSFSLSFNLSTFPPFLGFFLLFVLLFSYFLSSFHFAILPPLSLITFCPSFFLYFLSVSSCHFFLSVPLLPFFLLCLLFPSTLAFFFICFFPSFFLSFFVFLLHPSLHLWFLFSFFGPLLLSSLCF